MRLHSSATSKERNGLLHSGVAAVELAVVLPVLVLILFAMIESSRFLSSRHAVTGAAREVARLAAVTGGDDTLALNLAKNFIKRSAFTADSVEVNINVEPSGVPGMQLVTAEVTIDYEDVSVVGDPFSFNTSKVRGYSSMLGPANP